MMDAAGKERLWSKDFIFLAVSNALLFSGFHILIPTLPLFIASYGGTDAQIGLIMGSFTFSAILIRFYTAVGIRRMGKKAFLVSGIVICLLATVGYYWADSVAWSLAVRILHGVGFGIATTMYATIVSDLIPASRRGEGMGYFGLGTTLLMALAPAIGVWIVESYGFAILFCMATASQIFALYWTRAARVPAARYAAAQTGQSGLDRFVESKAVFPAFLSLLFGVSIGGVLSFVTLLAREVHIANAGYFFLIATSNVFLVRLVVGKVFDRKGPAWVIIPGAIILLTGMLLLSKVSSPALFLWAAVCYGLGTGTLFPALQTWMINMAVPERRSIASATFFNALDTGVGGGAIVLGIVAGQAGYQAVYFYAANVIICFIAFYILYLIRQTRKQLIEN
ncbi:MFS transporter [Sporomusa aerivorans]|uniref:MFS transporter n=1 Tax=Sporomusa aerivorans TaxID=204936 RepID=UPI00352A060A